MIDTVQPALLLCHIGYYWNWIIFFCNICVNRCHVCYVCQHLLSLPYKWLNMDILASHKNPLNFTFKIFQSLIQLKVQHHLNQVKMKMIFDRKYNLRKKKMGTLPDNNNYDLYLVVFLFLYHWSCFPNHNVFKRTTQFTLNFYKPITCL